jgi:sialate O-acetylesterase
MKKSVPLLICIFLLSTSYANIRLPNIIGSHMVLQQNAKVKIWGWGAPEEMVSITTNWDTTTYKVQTGNGAKWSTNITTPKAGGPYRITIKGVNEIVLEDVLIGEVWVCSGQSNMEWSGAQKLQQSIEEAPNANNNSIRFFYIPKATSNYPQENVDGHWVVCTPNEMLNFSAIGYFFGKNLVSKLSSPVGLINANWGGTPAETWTPEYVIAEDLNLSAAAKKQDSTPWWSPRVGDTYNAMIAPITDFKIAGVIWYQGESNVETYYAYESLFTKMIGAWRKAWGFELPFYFVQIAPYKYEQKLTGALLREAQTKAANYPNTGMVVVSDLVPDTNNIHPILKKEVALRLSNLALNKHYGMASLPWQSPSIASYRIEKNKIRIQFSNVDNGLMVKGNAVTCFELAGSDQHFFAATAKLEGNDLVVDSKDVPAPIAVRFGFNNTDRPNLFSKDGIPVNLFRTDNWELTKEK